MYPSYVFEFMNKTKELWNYITVNLTKKNNNLPACEDWTGIAGIVNYYYNVVIFTLLIRTYVCADCRPRTLHTNRGR